MKERQQNRNRFFTAKNITIGGGILTIIGKLIYNDLKKDNGFIKTIFKKFINADKIPDPKNNILDITDTAKRVESDNNLIK